MNAQENGFNKLNKLRKSFIKSLEFKSNAGFFELKVVWLTIAIVLASSVVLMTIIYFKSEMPKGCLSYECVNNFLTIFKVPIGIVALLIPILAVYATNHRSIQSKAAAEIAQAQNTFVNYYKHLDEFEKYGEKLKQDNYVIDLRRMHKRIYPDAENGTFSISVNTLSIVSGFLEECVIESRLYTTSSSTLFAQAEELITHRIGEMFINYNDCLIYKSEISDEAKSFKNFNNNKNYLRALKEALNLAEIFNYLWCFDAKYDRKLNEKIRIIRKILSRHKGVFGDGPTKPIKVVEELIRNGYRFESESAKKRATSYPAEA